MEESTRQWFLKLEDKIDKAIQSSIRMETKIDSIIKEATESESIQKALEMRVSTLEQEQARQNGAMRTLQILGGALVGLAIIGATVVMLLQ